MARRGDGVELIITARDESDRAINEVLDALRELDNAAQNSNGLRNLFQGTEERLARLADRQRQVSQALNDAGGAQRGIEAAGRFTEVLDEQSQAVTRAQRRLNDLTEEFEGVAAAANQSRQPAERLVDSLTRQQTRQEQLAEAMRRTREELQQANAALQANSGIDDRATQAITRQRQAVIEAGQAWRATTQAIREANDRIRQSTEQRDTATPLREQAAERLAQLRRETQEARAAATAANRQAARPNATNEIRDAAVAARQRLEALRAEVAQQAAIQAELTRRISAANRAIDSQTSSIARLSDRGREQRQRYQELRNALTEFERTAQAGGTQRQVQNIERLNASLAALQSNYDETSVRVRRAQEALNAASGPDPRAIAQREAYQRRIQEAIAAVQQEQAALAALRAQFQAAGLSADQLAARQAELDRMTQSLTEEQRRLVDQTRGLGGAAGQAGNRVRGLGDIIRNMGHDTRQSLGLFQRLRGELLSIAATYTGLYAVGGAIKGIYDVSVLMAKAESRFSVSFGGDTTKVADEIAFVRKEADRLKISFETALDQYSKFTAGLPEGLLALKEQRAVFTGLATAARTAGLSEDELSRAFNAVSQIFSKQQVQLEELKGQLAEAIPGAVQATAKALNMKPDELFKAIEAGNVSFEAAILLSDQLTRQFGQALPTALRSPAAAMADFQNAWSYLKLELANSGFIDSLTEGLRKATEALKSPEFKNATKEFANFLGDVIEASVDLLGSIDKLKPYLIIMGTLFATKQVLGYASAINGVAAAMTAYAATIAATNPLMARFIGFLALMVQRLAVVAGTAAAAFAFGTWLNNESREVQRYGASLVGQFEKLVIDVKTVWNQMLAALGGGFDKLIKLMVSKADNASRRILSALPVVGNFIDKMPKFDSFFEEDPGSELGKKFAEISAAAQKEKDKVDAIVSDMWTDIDEKFAKKGKSGEVLPVDQVKKDVDLVNEAMLGLFSDEELAALRDRALKEDGASAAKALDEMRNRIRLALIKIDAEIQERSGATLKIRLDAIKAEFIKLQGQIAKAGGATAFPQAQSSIDQLVAIKQLEETEKEINKLIQERRELNAGVGELAEKNVIGVEAATQRISENNARITQQMDEALSVAKQISTAVNSAPLTQKVDNQAALVAMEKEAAAREPLERTEKAINDLIRERRELNTSVNEMAKLGVIDIEEATTRINANNAALLPQMTAALEVARQISAEVTSAPLLKSVDNQASLVAMEQEVAKREQLLALEERISLAMEVRGARIQTINTMVELGITGELQGRQQVYQINAETDAQLTELIEKATAMATAMKDPAMVENLRQIKLELSQTKDQLVDVGSVQESFASGFAGAFDSFISGAQSAKDAFRNFATDFLRQIAKMILQQMVLRALQSIGGAAAPAPVPVMHTGGVVGQAGMRRRAPLAAFAGAIKYHSGGVAGLKPNEVPTILERGEEVLTRDDARHRANGGGAQPKMDVKIVNTIDSVSFLREALNSSAGQKILVNAVQSQRSSIKSVLG